MSEIVEKKELEDLLDKARAQAEWTVGSMNKGFGHWYANILYQAGYRQVFKSEENMNWTEEEHSFAVAIHTLYPSFEYVAYNKCGQVTLYSGVPFKDEINDKFSITLPLSVTFPSMSRKDGAYYKVKDIINDIYKTSPDEDDVVYVQ